MTPVLQYSDRSYACGAVLTGGDGSSSAGQRPPEGGAHIAGALPRLAEEGCRGERVQQRIDGGVEGQDKHRHPREHLHREGRDQGGAVEGLRSGVQVRLMQ